MRSGDKAKETPERIKNVPLLILFFLLLFGSFAGTLDEVSLAYASGHISGVSSLLCAVLYFAWLRGADIWKAVVCFAAILILVTIGTLAKVGQANLKVKQDAETIADVRFDANGNPVLPADAASRGPMSKILATLAGETSALNNEYMTRLETAGVYALFDAQRLAANPKVLKNCDAIAAIGPEIATFRSRHFGIMENARRSVAASDMPDDIKQSAAAGMKKSLAQARSDAEGVWRTNAEQIIEATAICHILARRNWEVQRQDFAFRSRRDMDEFDRHNQRVNALAAEQQAIIDASRARLQQRQDAMKEMLN